MRVRKTIMLRPSLPRFLNMGDQFEASVMVDNQSEVTQAVMVGTRGVNVKMPGSVQDTVEIPPGESREVRFPMAVDSVGIMRLQFAALSNQGRDATELDIPVLVPATKQAFADYGMTSGSVQRQVQLPKDALPGFGGLEVSMSSTALNGLEDAVDVPGQLPATSARSRPRAGCCRSSRSATCSMTSRSPTSTTARGVTPWRKTGSSDCSPRQN